MEARQRINATALELDNMDLVISPLLKQGQPLSHIFAAHEGDLSCSRRTIYNCLDCGAFSAGPIDLPHKVRYKPRKKRIVAGPIPNYRQERTYRDFSRFMESHGDTNIVEMGTVEGGRSSGQVLLTMFFRNCGFMAIFLLEHNTQECVCQVFEQIEGVLGTEKMAEVFGVILTDNGSEFKDPSLLEKNLAWECRTRIFYCNPMASWQKRELRKIMSLYGIFFQKAGPLIFSNRHVTLMMNHINSTARASLNGRTPFQLASLLLPETFLRYMSAQGVPADAILLKPQLLKGG